LPYRAPAPLETVRRQRRTCTHRQVGRGGGGWRWHGLLRPSLRQSCLGRRLLGWRLLGWRLLGWRLLGWRLLSGHLLAWDLRNVGLRLRLRFVCRRGRNGELWRRPRGDGNGLRRGRFGLYGRGCNGRGGGRGGLAVADAKPAADRSQGRCRFG